MFDVFQTGTVHQPSTYYRQNLWFHRRILIYPIDCVIISCLEKIKIINRCREALEEKALRAIVSTQSKAL